VIVSCGTKTEVSKFFKPPTFRERDFYNTLSVSDTVGNMTSETTDRAVTKNECSREGPGPTSDSKEKAIRPMDLQFRFKTLMTL
jgi:hypothetical protein